MNKRGKILLGAEAAVVVGFLAGSASKAHDDSFKIHEATRINYCLQQPHGKAVDAMLQRCLRDDTDVHGEAIGIAVTNHTFQPGKPVSDVAKFGDALVKDANTIDVGSMVMPGVVALLAGGAILAGAAISTRAKANKSL